VLPILQALSLCVWLISSPEFWVLGTDEFNPCDEILGCACSLWICCTHVELVPVQDQNAAQQQTQVVCCLLFVVVVVVLFSHSFLVQI
jgi:multisubunit Na+/H+ antiporter MnhE subunit